MIDQACLNMETGRQISIERISGVNDNMTQSHYHEYFELYYLESGQRYHMTGDNLYLIDAGEFILFPPYNLHYSYGETNIAFKRLVLYFTKDMVDIPGALDILTGAEHVFKPDRKQKAYALLKTLLNEQDINDPFSDISQHLLLNELIILLIRNVADTIRPEKESRINKVIRYLQANYTNNITINDLANQFYLSPYYLCREFKKHTNSTLIQYINTLRIIHSQKLLQETNITITEISKTVGFSNVTHFNRIFKSVTGSSPKRCRQQYREQQKCSSIPKKNEKPVK